MSLTKYKAMKAKLALELQNQASSDTLSYQEMIKTIQKLPRTLDTDRIIIHFIDRIEDINGTGGYVSMNMPKEKALCYLEFEKAWMKKK